MTALLKIFDIVPGWVYAIIIVLALGTAGVERDRLRSESAAHAKTKADAADYRAQVANDKTQIALRTIKTLDQWQLDHAAQEGRLAAIDTQFTKRKADDANQIATLTSRLNAGTVGLRIGAICTANTALGGSTSSTGQVSGMDQGGSAELNPAAGRAYTALRQNILDTESKLAAAQAALIELETKIYTKPD